MTMKMFDNTLERIKEDKKKQATNMRKIITPEEKFAICLS